MSDNGHINHGNRYKLQTVEFRQIEQSNDNPDKGHYSDVGYLDNVGKIDAFENIIEKVHADGENAFGQLNTDRDLTASANSNRSMLSFLANGLKTLHIFKLSDASNLIFDPYKHPIEAAFYDNYGHRENAAIPELFSDCRYLYFDADGELEPRIPYDHRHHQWGYGDTQWACFVFNGKLAKQLKNDWGMRFAFHFHVIDRDSRLAPYQQHSALQKEKSLKPSGVSNRISLFHPPFWPGHHKPEIL